MSDYQIDYGIDNETEVEHDWDLGDGVEVDVEDNGASYGFGYGDDSDNQPEFAMEDSDSEAAEHDDREDRELRKREPKGRPGPFGEIAGAMRSGFGQFFSALSGVNDMQEPEDDPLPSGGATPDWEL